MQRAAQAWVVESKSRRPCPESRPAAEAKKLAIPILILQGGRDFQVGAAEFEAWKTALKGRNDVTAKSYPTLNHLFVAGEGKSNEQEYRKPGHVSVEVIDDITKFVNP